LGAALSKPHHRGGIKTSSEARSPKVQIVHCARDCKPEASSSTAAQPGMLKPRIWAASQKTAPRQTPNEAELKERKAMAMGGVPEPYLDTWARLQCQRPFGASDQEWWQVLDDAGRFLDQWGSRAVEFGWTAGDLFDVPRDGKPGGLVWFLGGESVQAIGPRRMVTQDGRVFNRFEN
jgi:hypothetical protein